MQVLATDDNNNNFYHAHLDLFPMHVHEGGGNTLICIEMSWKNKKPVLEVILFLEAFFKS